MKAMFFASLCLTVLGAAGGTLLQPVAATEDGIGSAASAIGPGKSASVLPRGEPLREDWVYWENCDGTFENGYSLMYAFVQDPYYGAFAEGYEGPAHVTGIRLYLTQAGDGNGLTSDLYIWGVGPEGPGAVLAMCPDVVFDDIPYWPDVGAYDLEIEADVGYRFYVGHRGDFESGHGFFTGVDLDGGCGNAWVFVAPEMGFPSGWQRPSVIWGPPEEQSLGIGVYVFQPSGVEDLIPEEKTDTHSTWGQIKALYRR